MKLKDDWLTNVYYTDIYESYDLDGTLTTTLYFDAPKELIVDKHPDADKAEIQIEKRGEDIEICICPVRVTRTYQSVYDSDPFEIDEADIKTLFNMAGKTM